MKRTFALSTIATPPASPGYGIYTKKNCLHQNKLSKASTNGKQLPKEILTQLHQFKPNPSIDDDMDGIVKHIQILVFLDAQGKQFVDYIDQVLESLHVTSQNICVSCNMEGTRTNMLQTNNQQTKYLSRYLGVLDPLGGDQYPLNYIVVVYNGVVVSKSPVKLGLNPYQRFGVPLENLKTFLEDVVV